MKRTTDIYLYQGVRYILNGLREKGVLNAAPFALSRSRTGATIEDSECQ